MISIQTPQGELVKVLQNISQTQVGVHNLFGFITKEKARERLAARKRQGFEFNTSQWKCEFQINKKENSFEVSNLKNCEVIRKEEKSWRLKTPIGELILSQVANASVSGISLPTTPEEASWDSKYIKRAIGIILALLLVTAILDMTSKEEEEEEQKKKDSITVTVVKQPQAVSIRPTPAVKAQPLTQKQKSHRAVQRNLGFLGMVGSKSLSKVTGGVPQKLKEATAGAGEGGDAGSGGELVAGLGKGLKKTTVGNTGVAGLGGVGTKGRGGGKGGYGTTQVASGEGVGISAISVSSGEMIVDGGLSRYAINATIAKYLNQVRRCYEEQLKYNPSLEGLVGVSFEIGGNGMLNFAKVSKSSLGNKKVENCITTKMMGWKFPTPKGGVNVSVNYPFMLRPVGI